MKALLTTIAILAATFAVAPTGFAAETPGQIAGYLPSGNTLKRGFAVRPVFTPEFQTQLQAFGAKLSALPLEKQKAVAAVFDIAVLPAFDKDLWDKAGYDKYKEEWKKTTIEPNQEVAMSMQSLGNDEWRILSLTVDQASKKMIPLTLGALRYNARTNTWISNNGELKASNYETTENIYGAQKGIEWKFEKEDALTKVNERIRFTKTTDGKFIYISYSFQETSVISGTSIAQGGYTLRFPVDVIGASVGNQTKH